MAVVLPMAASAHHPSLRPRRLSTTSSAWTSGTPTTNGTHIHQHHPHQPRSQFMFPGHNPRIRPSPSRTRSASTVASRTPSSSPSRYSSASPKMSAGSMGAGGTTSAAGPSALNGHHLSSGMLGTVSVTSSSTGHRTRRPRRRADEVERLYKCTWNGCEKSYGTLSHLNDHVRLQRHGNKREPHGESNSLLVDGLSRLVRIPERRGGGALRGTSLGHTGLQYVANIYNLSRIQRGTSDLETRTQVTPAKGARSDDAIYPSLSGNTIDSVHDVSGRFGRLFGVDFGDGDEHELESEHESEYKFGKNIETA